MLHTPDTLMDKEIMAHAGDYKRQYREAKADRLIRGDTSEEAELHARGVLQIIANAFNRYEAERDVNSIYNSILEKALKNRN